MPQSRMRSPSQRRQTAQPITRPEPPPVPTMSVAHALKTLALNAIGERVRAITGGLSSLIVQSLHPRAQDILQVIQAYPVDVWDKPWMALILQSAFDVMPPWVLALLRQPPACAVHKHATRLAVQLSAEPVQWMLNQQGVSAIARQRVQGGASYV